MIKPVYRIDDEAQREVLLDTSENIDVTSVEYRELVIDLLDTIKILGVVGLSAPQIGVSARVFVMKWGDGYKVITNPKILKLSEKKWKYKEGCVSCPIKFFTNTYRYKQIKIEYYDYDTDDVEVIKLKTKDSIVAQHEMDHFNGVLIWPVDEPYPAEDENAQVIV